MGFSLGALLAFEVCHELSRRGAPSPIALFASGRGAPHAIHRSAASLETLQRADDHGATPVGQTRSLVNSRTRGAGRAIAKRARDGLCLLASAGVLRLVQRDYSYSSGLAADVHPAVGPRAAALLRLGALLDAVHVGDARDDATDAQPEREGSGAPDADALTHAANVPRLDGKCHVISLAGGADAYWPPLLVRRWADVATSAAHHRHVVLPSVSSHAALVNAPKAMEFVFDECARLARNRAWVRIV
eukprot:155266-Prymnesium_polylepis.1